MNVNEEFAARLAHLDVCSVSDALDLLKLGGAVSGILPRTTRTRIAGPVVTVRLKEGRAPEGSSPRHLCTAAIELAEPGGVIVVEQRTGIDAAGWGGILSNAAVTKGLAGVIVDGPARDIDEAADLNFPVFARSQTARTARGRIHEAETGGAITIGDADVRTGDWVIADSSGVAFIPAAKIGDVLKAAERIAARERLMTSDVLAGQAVSRVMGADYEQMIDSREET